jgi:4-amino-4-deoxy-L-arabinose transferase-like glycosyltransferase
MRSSNLTLSETEPPQFFTHHVPRTTHSVSPITHYSLLIILLVYFALATLFAFTTPAWQNPDEPAHYNYIAHIARGEGLPVLQMGDYDQRYMQQLTGQRFPAELSIEPVRYEFHQPPLYYLTAVPIFWLSDGNLTALRLYSVLLGGGVIFLIFLIIGTIFPNQPLIILGATAFAALLPMHVAIMASVNNDPLAALIIAGAMFVLVRWIRGWPLAVGRWPLAEKDDRRLTTGDRRLAQQATRNTQQAIRNSQSAIRNPHFGPLLFLGLLMGLGFLTKATAYILAPVLVGTVGLFSLRRWGWRRAFVNVLLLLPWALLLGMPLWVRNISLYGNLDFLGLQWHDLVVTGQPTTAEWIAVHGWPAYWERALHFTFSSFWGVFGWMGVFMDSRVYAILRIFSGLILLGVIGGTVRLVRSTVKPAADQLWSLFALLLLLLGVMAAYVWYNLGFVQHQGRYLFPALLPIGLVVAFGWKEMLRPMTSLVGALLLFLWLVAAIILGTLAGTLSLWTVVLLVAAIVFLLANVALTLRWRQWQPGLLFFAAPFVFLALLDVLIPFLYIIPKLQ